MLSPTIVWLRHDLRLADHPTLLAAVERGTGVLPVYIWSPEDAGRWAMGGASKWWLHHSLTQLDASLRKVGSRLIIRVGNASDALGQLIEETGADAVYWTRRYEPAHREIDTKIKEDLRQQGIEVESFPGSLLFEPWEVQTQTGGPYQVFTPFWRRCRSLSIAAPLDAPAELPAVARWPKSVSLASLNLLPTIPWDSSFAQFWSPGEAGATDSLDRFLQGAIGAYRELRDWPEQSGTSRLSPHLRFGEISPRQIWGRVVERFGTPPVDGTGKDDGPWTFLSEIGWRDFGYHILYHFPHTPLAPLRENFSNFPWETSPDLLKRWQQGTTGYPIVDAGMRELWTTGWMHNRVRMIVASFLTKHLRQSWQRGADWFWDTLVDADLASNTLGWQWAAGCGADAAPYFRIFNPMLQGAKFDPDGTYVKRWVPELARLNTRWIHAPWTAPQSALQAAGIRLGTTYPEPIVDHPTARAAALEAFATLRQ
ncbi:MAG: deoxyribodipyrimidine photo-lyase [Planctomycetaceae bacterium]